MTIWKFPAQIEDRFTVLMPAGARLLGIHMQNNAPQLWAIVDPGSKGVARVIHCRGTGHPARGIENMPHIGTVIMHGGGLVFHFFDGGESP